MSGHVVVRVPASTSNLGAGFDCVGVAVDRWLTVEAALEEGGERKEGGVPRNGSSPLLPLASLLVERHGTLAGLDVAPEDDLLTDGFRVACRAAGVAVPAGLHFRAHSEIPIARGLGSSAAAVVAGAAAANVLLGLGLDDRALVTVAADREGHADNAAAAVCGGAVLVLGGGRRAEEGGGSGSRVHARERGPDVIVAELTVHPELALVFAVPDFAVETTHARSILPRRVAHEVARLAVARGAALVRGLSTGEEALLSHALDDVLHVPYRRVLVPGYDAVTEAARRAGAYGGTLSGSGSSIVAVSPRACGDAVGAAMTVAWAAHGIPATYFTNAARVPGYSATPDAQTPPQLTPQLAGTST
ncbi:MAG: homoserine kinase [Gemmatimonadaceae bacterium]